MPTLDAPVALEWTVASLAAAGGALVAAVGATYGLTNDTGVGAGFFPTVAGALMVLAGLMWLAQLAIAGRARPIPATPEGGMSAESALVSLLEDDGEDEADGSDFPDRTGWVRVGTIIGSILAAALLLPVLGYTLVMILQLGIVLYFVSKRPLWLSAVVAAGAALGSRLIFEVWLGTSLPTSSIDLLAGWGL